MSGVSLKNISKIYPGQVIAVKDFNLEISNDEFVVLVGPSGCGKSTVLRMIAGLEEISQGELYIDDKLSNDLPSKDRNIAMVFQNYALYPNMSVYKNMAFGLQVRKTPKDEIDTKINEVAKALNIEHLLQRMPNALSGGEQQRVALGRAMMRSPKIFLLDEPLSNLDAKLRTSMRAEITKLHKRLGITFVYVTHDQTEAMTMADRIVVMKDGSVLQVGTPQGLYDYPCNMFVASFIGTPQMNFIPVEIVRNGDGFAAKTYDCLFKIPCEKNACLARYMNKSLIMGIRPEDLYYEDDPAAGSSSDRLHVEVELAEPTGAEILLYLNFCHTQLIAKVPSKYPVKSASRLTLLLDMNKAHFFRNDEQGNSIMV